MSYNGYNYSHYFNQPTSQNHVRQESQANHQRIPGSSSHVAPSHHQQQAGIQNYSATQSNDRQQPLPQASPEQWYMSGNMASSGGHSGSTPATSSPAPQSQYINGMAGRKRRSHIDTSALGSLAYASGLESSGADSQLLQMDRRNPSDHAINQRGIQTPPAHLVSPMHGNSTSALNNNQGHVRSDSLASSHSQSISISRDSQRQTASGYDNPSVASPNYEHHRHRQAGPTISSDASSHHRGYSGAFTSNTGRALSHNEVPNSQIPPQQAQSLPSEHRTSPPSGSQQTISGVQLEIPQRQVSSAHRNQGPKVPELNTLNSRLSPGDKSQRTQIHGPLADKNARLDPALRKNQITPKSDTQINGPLNGSGHIPYQLHPQSTSHTNDSQGARNLTTQMDQLREGQLPQGQTQRIAQLHPPNNIAYHDQHHYSPAVHSTAPITIDPSRVFNPYHQEYQRRKALAEAQEPENATQVNPRLHHGSDEALSGPLAPAEQRATSRVSVGAKSPILSDQERTGGQNKGSMISTLESVAAPGDGDANVGTNGSSSGDKVQMEAEMRLMLDKMREYKSKDPSLFLQIWEQVKKGTPQKSTQTQVHSQVTHADPESSQTQTQPPPGSVVSASANHTDNVRLPSPSPTLVQQPVAWESREYSLPDLGKYPALRRRRGAGKKPRVSKDSQTRISPRSTQVANPSQASQSLVHEQGDKSNIPTSTLSLFSYDPTRRSDGYSDSIRATAGLNDEQTPKSATDLPRNLEIGHQVAGSTASAAEPVDVSGLVQGRPPQSTSITSPSVQPGQQAQRSLSANPVTAPSSQTLSAGIIWPDSKKTALANAAMIELTCLTVNAGKQITTAQIRTILDSNPSYIELCEKFEGMGFVFDRGHFARSLLAAVPDVNSSTRARSPTNAPVQNCMDDAPQISNDAALRAPAMQGRQDSTSNGMTEVTNTDAPRSPNMTAMGGLAAIALENTRLAPNGVYTAGAPVKPFIGTPGILPRSPGRPRKDGSPAQPRKATQLRQAHSDHPDSLAPNGSLHLVGQTSGPLREESIPSGVGIPFANKPALRDTANGGTIDKNIGLLEGGETLQKATKYGHQFNVRWDDERRLTQSSEVPKTRGHAAPDMAVHASAKRDVALNLNGGPLRAVINSNLPPANVGTTEASTTRVATKEEMARKRSFNDIVDLTQYLSGEDDDPSRASKKRRKEDPFKTHTDFPMGLTPSVYSPSLAVSPYPGPGNGTPIADGPMSISRFNYMTPGPLSQKQALYMNLIKPLDKKMALRRSEYNAKTIARDVLIAAGRHPNMRPLNAHLDVLRKNLFVVGNGSDLSTFDWDLVDPKPVVEAIIGLDTSTMHNADDEEDGLTPAEYFTPVQTIHQPRRDLVFATGGEVETLGNDVVARSSGKGALLKHRGLPRHSDPGHRARPAGLGDNDNAYRTQGRGETSTSENKSPGQKASGERDSGTTAHDASSARVADEAISGTEIPRGASTSQYAGTPDKRPRGRPPNSARASSATTSQPPKPGSSKDGTDEDKPKRRRGRPPGSKNNTSRASIGPAAGQFAVPTRLKSNENTTRSRSGLRIASTLSDDQPFAVMVEGGSSGMNFTSALRRGADIDRKRKSKSQDAVRRLRGRPSTASKAEPTYRVYDCRWQTCKAELHNLETLRKHVAKVHRAKAAFGGIPCLWAGCGKVTFVQDRKTGNHTRVHHHLDFGSEALWDVHMNKTHLEAFAWDYGDGPSAGPSDGPDTDVSDYLSDRHGRRTTPQTLSNGPQDALILPAKKQPLRAFNKVHGNKTDMEKAQAIFRGLERRKKAIGPGIERGGCTLVTSARRAALRDDEFAANMIEEDDDT